MIIIIDNWTQNICLPNQPDESQSLVICIPQPRDNVAAMTLCFIGLKVQPRDELFTHEGFQPS